MNNEKSQQKNINKVILCVRLKPKTLKKLEKIAENKEERKTELARHIIENYVNQYD